MGMDIWMYYRTCGWLCIQKNTSFHFLSFSFKNWTSSQMEVTSQTREIHPHKYVKELVFDRIDYWKNY